MVYKLFFTSNPPVCKYFIYTLLVGNIPLYFKEIKSLKTSLHIIKHTQYQHKNISVCFSPNSLVPIYDEEKSAYNTW